MRANLRGKENRKSRRKVEQHPGPGIRDPDPLATVEVLYVGAFPSYCTFVWCISTFPNSAALLL